MTTLYQAPEELGQSVAIYDRFMECDQPVANASRNIQEPAGPFTNRLEQTKESLGDLLDDFKPDAKYSKDSGKGSLQLIGRFRTNNQTLSELPKRSCKVKQLRTGGCWKYLAESILDWRYNCDQSLERVTNGVDEHGSPTHFFPVANNLVTGISGGRNETAEHVVDVSEQFLGFFKVAKYELPSLRPA